MLAVSAVLMWPPRALASGVNASAKFEVVESDRESENRITGESTETSSTVLRQRYFLNFSRSIYPYLIITGGSNFNVEDVESEFGDRKSTRLNSSH